MKRAKSEARRVCSLGEGKNSRRTLRRSAFLNPSNGWQGKNYGVARGGWWVVGGEKKRRRKADVAVGSVLNDASFRPPTSDLRPLNSDHATTLGGGKFRQAEKRFAVVPAIVASPAAIRRPELPWKGLLFLRPRAPHAD